MDEFLREDLVKTPAAADEVFDLLSARMRYRWKVFRRIGVTAP
jgi:hypothetical protein